MLSTVSSQTRMIRKSFRAMWAFKKVFTSMYSFMSSQTRPSRKTFLAIEAIIRFFTCMYSFVVGQIRQLRKTFLAIGATRDDNMNTCVRAVAGKAELHPNIGSNLKPALSSIQLSRKGTKNFCRAIEVESSRFHCGRDWPRLRRFLSLK